MASAFRCLLVCSLVLASLDTPEGRGLCAVPIVNKQGFKPNTTVMYRVGISPNGAPFPAGSIKCVRRAFDAWSRANSATRLNVRFEWGTGGIVVRRDKPGGLALNAKRGGGWTEPVRSDDGYLQQASIWLSSDPRLVSSCEGITKIILHELGHLHGLSDNEVQLDASVMNRAGGRNDRRNRIPLSPSACDAVQALSASALPQQATISLALNLRGGQPD